MNFEDKIMRFHTPVTLIPHLPIDIMSAVGQTYFSDMNVA